MRSNVRRLLAGGLIGLGVALGLAAAPGLTPPARAAAGTLTLTPASGTVSAKPFTTFTASACPTGYGQSAKLTITYTTKTITLVTLTGPGLDTRGLTADITDSLSTIFIKNAIFVIADGAYPVELHCQDANAADSLAAEGTLAVTGANWTYTAIQPSASPSTSPSPSTSTSPSTSPSPSRSPSASPSPSTSTSTSPSPSPSPSTSEPTPSDSPSPTGTTTTSPTPTPTSTGDDDDDEDDLPLTGPAAAATAAGGLGLVLAGAGLLYLTRRRAAGEHS